MALLDKVSIRVLETTIGKRMRVEGAAALVLLTGMPGTGKSSFALTACELLDKSFTVDRVVFNQEEYLKKISETKHGQIILWDEAGEFGARKSMHGSSIDTSLILQMLRYTNISTIFTVPASSFLDITVSRLMNFYGEMVKFDREKADQYYASKTGCKFKVVDPSIRSNDPRLPGMYLPKVTLRTHRAPNQWVQEQAKKYPELVLRNTNGVTTLKTWHPKGIWLPMCSKELWSEYCKVKDKHFHDVLNEINSKSKSRLGQKTDCDMG
jgi:hypothetical protein